MEIIRDIEQGSDEWLNLRLGMVTASKMKDVLSKGRGTAPSVTAKTYMMDLIAEKLTGNPSSFYENEAMKWGTETEPQARAMYELRSGNDVEEVAFVTHNEFIGISPDGLVGSDGLLEIKCPKSVTQLNRALSDNYSKSYNTQIQCQLWVTEREWCDFVSFDPRLNCNADYLQQRVYRDEEFISNMEEKTYAFVESMNELIEQLTKESD